MQLRDHTFLGMTQSLCPECLALVPAKIIVREAAGFTFASAARRTACARISSAPTCDTRPHGVQPAGQGAAADRRRAGAGCPYDCGLCTEHEQHTCVGLVEITSSCNLRAPCVMPTAGRVASIWRSRSVPQAIDRLVQVEGRPEVLQLSGGEPTMHPDFLRVLEYGCASRSTS